MQIILMFLFSNSNQTEQGRQKVSDFRRAKFIKGIYKFHEIKIA